MNSSMFLLVPVGRSGDKNKSTPFDSARQAHQKSGMVLTVTSEVLHTASLLQECHMNRFPVIPNAPNMNSVYICLKHPFKVKTVNCETVGH